MAGSVVTRLCSTYLGGRTEGLISLAGLRENNSSGSFGQGSPRRKNKKHKAN